jgi:predicted secreted Zn-dependent protease
VTQSRWIGLIAGEIVALCCCLGLFGFIVLGSAPAVVTPTSIARVTSSPRATATRELTQTPPRTNTLVIPNNPPSSTLASGTPRTRAPTRNTSATGGYAIIIPTPTAPKIVYPIDFNSSFVVSTYQVAGKTKEELSRSLEASAQSDPHESSGSRYYARTDWLLSAHWLWNETAIGCEVNKADVNITITMTLPVVAGTAGMSNDLVSRWNAFIKNTQTHETGHVKLAEQGARDYQRDLGNFVPAASCDVLQMRLKDLFDKSFAAIDKANVNYDAQTQHGFTQGAVFP